MKNAETFCVREVSHLLASLDCQFGCLNGDRLYSVVLSLKRSVARLQGERWGDTDESLLRMSDYLFKLSSNVRIKTRVLGHNDAEMLELGTWLAHWCRLKAQELNTWKRIELIRFLSHCNSVEAVNCKSNVLCFQSNRKAA
jgi:hypothetical protein